MNHRPQKNDGAGGSGGELGWHEDQSPRWINRHISRWLRWQTERSLGDFKGLSPEQLKARDLALAATLSNLVHKDGRVRNGAVRNLLAMEAQNMIDEGKIGDGPTININVTDVAAKLERLASERRDDGNGQETD